MMRSESKLLIFETEALLLADITGTVTAKEPENGSPVANKIRIIAIAKIWLISLFFFIVVPLYRLCSKLRRFVVSVPFALPSLYISL